MKHEGGQIRGVIDYGMKRRSDCIGKDEALRRAIAHRVTRRLTPQLLRVLRFHAIHAEWFESGDLRFPEYGRQTYRPPTGGACVFSCGLLHEATPVTRGRRFAFLPFL
jgi:predicted 2-oxoglutarate/Fe(II)-dependent dioxygenase YbiX